MTKDVRDWMEALGECQADRTILIEALRTIQEWDMGHSEALSVERVQEIVEKALYDVGAGP